MQFWTKKMSHQIIVLKGHDITHCSKGIIVHGCNARGSMGAGVAQAICEKYPIVKQEYQSLHRKSGLKMGSVQYVQIRPHLVVANAITQLTFGRNRDILYADYDAIRKCFADINLYAKQFNHPISYPLIGCGLANGKWSVVSEIIKDELKDHKESYLWLLK